MKMKMIALLWVVLTIAACGPVKYVKTWKNPEAQPVTWTGKRVAAFVLHPVKKEREDAEQALAKDLTRRGAIGVPGYSVIPPEAEKDKAMAKRILSEARMDGAVLMEIVGFENELITTGGDVSFLRAPYSTFWGYWDYGWTVRYTPGNVFPKTTLMVQTLVYSVDQDKLLWAGTSKTTNPEKTGTFVKQLADAAGQEIRKAGLLRR